MVMGVIGKPGMRAKLREQFKLMFRSQNWKMSRVCQEVKEKEEI